MESSPPAPPDTCVLAMCHDVHAHALAHALAHVLARPRVGAWECDAALIRAVTTAHALRVVCDTGQLSPEQFAAGAQALAGVLLGCRGAYASEVMGRALLRAGVVCAVPAGPPRG